MKGHIIPQVYQKKWHTKNGSNNVYYFEKNNLKNPINKSGGNVKNSMCEVDEYILTETDKLNGVKYNDPYDLENFFCNEYENKWNDILNNSLLNDFLNRIAPIEGNVNYAVKKEDIEDTPFESNLLNYVILQYFRIYKNFKELNSENEVAKKIISTKKSLYGQETDIKINVTELSKLLNNETYMRSIWKQLLLDCKEQNLNHSNLLCVREIIKECNLTFIFLKEELNSRFILSDNPVIWNCKIIKDFKDLDSGIYFAIHPNIMIAYLKYPENIELQQGDALCLFGNDDFVKYMNYLLWVQSKEKVGFMNTDIASNIDKNVDFKTSWNKLFIH